MVVRSEGRNVPAAPASAARPVAGPVRGRWTYWVGERGAELVVKAIGEDVRARRGPVGGRGVRCGGRAGPGRRRSRAMKPRPDDALAEQFGRQMEQALTQVAGCRWSDRLWPDR
ncbi:hypothetical protein OOK41_00025 [Micromonospora sp. NBC_01655]|uniref:hypothetical protein n=1 Tax=Micromonospora sp. NBC_01655 TaxID=2975983 RepID=UPI00225A26F7|nr:hypothetical protein [Micromonospora sp. NBC_01655]MCX4468717.1 hypothetical protein [Micromonospora sp. NBC_01655]